MLPALLLPNLAAMLAMATLAYCLFLYGAGELFRDSDTGWHIRTGESILATRTLPRTDPYSFSKAGEPWIDWEWGSDVLMGLAHRVDGLRGVAVLTALSIGACSWLWCRLSFAAEGDFLIAALLAPPMVTTASLHWLARPHVFGWLFLLATMLYLERVRRVGWPSLLAVAGVSAIWANLHASFFLGPGIALLYAAGHFLTDRAKSLRFVWIALAALAGSFLNPYGWHLHAHVLAYLRNEELTSRIAEFQSFNFHDKSATQVALTMGLGALGVVLALTQRKLAHFLVGSVLLFAALRSARVIPLVALAVLPLAIGAITQALHGVRRLKLALDYSAGLRAIDARVNGGIFTVVATALMLIALRAPAFSQQIGFSAKQYPVRAADAIAKLPENARIAATDHFGGYLIYRYSGTRKVFFDGRSDFYGAEFMQGYFVLNTARPGWREIVRSFGFTHALLPTDSALADALEHAGWSRLATDPVATLWEAP